MKLRQSGKGGLVCFHRQRCCIEGSRLGRSKNSSSLRNRPFPTPLQKWSEGKVLGVRTGGLQGCPVSSSELAVVPFVGIVLLLLLLEAAGSDCGRPPRSVRKESWSKLKSKRSLTLSFKESFRAQEIPRKLSTDSNWQVMNRDRSLVVVFRLTCQ